MAGSTGYTKPTNKVVVFNPYAKLPTQNLKVHTAASCIPGRLVKRYTTADGEVIVNTVGNPPIGFLGYEATNPKYVTGAGTAGANMLITDAYAVDSIVAVHNGPGVVYVGWLASGTHVYQGDLLVPAAAGTLDTAAAITVTQVTGTAHNIDVTAGSVPVGGPVVAIAEQEIDASGITAIIVRSLI